MTDTIVALATPTGRSGIGVIRLSGSESLTVTRKLVGSSGAVFVPRRASVQQIVDGDGEVVDQAVVTFFKNPHSYTGEDIVEVSCHGSPILLRGVLDMCLAHGARLAGAGEFTLRALANGRIDLAEAEAIRDLIDAQTTASARQAVRQMRGELSRSLLPLKDDLLNIIVVLESALEFVEDDLPELQAISVAEKLGSLIEETSRLASTFKAGKLLREGIRVALVGRPNVGKSSLFNKLLGSERAIVTEIPGTTRDQLHERLVIGDIPVSLIDTAGLRETTDLVERIGVERSRSALADADVVVVLLDSTELISDEDRQIIDSVRDLRHLIAVNKCDKASSARVETLRSEMSSAGNSVLAISAKTGAGLEELTKAVIEPFQNCDDSDGLLITDARHYDLLLRAATEMNESRQHLVQRQSEEIVLIGLHNALRYLGEITGETTTEDMLTRIFSTFCIGK